MKPLSKFKNALESHYLLSDEHKSDIALDDQHLKKRKPSNPYKS